MKLRRDIRDDGREYVAVLSGVGGYAALSNYTALGGQLTVFALPASYSTHE